MQTNHSIVAAARGWVGTRFHHQGRVCRTARHQGGVDCLGLLTGVAAALGLRAPDGTPLAALDERDYGHYPDAGRLAAGLARALGAVAAAEIRPGDILLLEVDGNAQHLAIVSEFGDGLGMIHAYAPARKVVEHALDDWWRAKIVQAFRYTVPLL